MAHPFIEHLKKDHVKQREMGQRLREAQSEIERKQAWEEFFMELYPHLYGEEASIFDYLLSKGGTARVRANEALQEHYVDRILMREINELNLDGETFHAKAYVLTKVNQVHLDEEERVHFPLLEELATPKEMDELFNKKYERREEEVKGEARAMLIRGK